MDSIILYFPNLSRRMSVSEKGIRSRRYRHAFKAADILMKNGEIVENFPQPLTVEFANQVDGEIAF